MQCWCCWCWYDAVKQAAVTWHQQALKALHQSCALILLPPAFAAILTPLCCDSQTVQVATGGQDGLVQIRSTSSGRLIMTLSTDPNTKGSVRSGTTGTGTGTLSAAGGQGGGTRPKSGNGVSGAGFRVEVDAPGASKAGGDEGAEGGASGASRAAAAADAAAAAGAEAPATPATAPRPGHAASGDASPDSSSAAGGAAHLTGAAPVAGVWYVKSPGGAVAADGFGAWGDKVQLLAAATHDGSTMCVVLWDAVSGRKVR